jgi:hypothetical protein
LKGETLLAADWKWLHDDIENIRHELKIHNKIAKEELGMFKSIDLDGEARGDLSLSKEYKDKLDEIKRKIGCKTLTETMEMLIDDKSEYFKEAFKE